MFVLKKTSAFCLITSRTFIYITIYLCSKYNKVQQRSTNLKYFYMRMHGKNRSRYPNCSVWHWESSFESFIFRCYPKHNFFTYITSSVHLLLTACRHKKLQSSDCGQIIEADSQYLNPPLYNARYLHRQINKYWVPDSPVDPRLTAGLSI